MEKAVFLMLLLMSAFWLSAGITSELEQDEPNSVSQLQLSKEGELFQLTWELTSPTEHVQGYSVKWEDGTSNSLTFNFSETLGQLDVPECSCGQKITITVSPFNKHGDPIGGSGRMLFICQDIVTIDSLNPEAEMIDASWSVRCPSARLTGVMVMWHNELYAYEMMCQYSGSIKNTSSKDGCHGLQHKLHQCTDYEVSIQPLTDATGYSGLLAEKQSRTLHGASISIGDLKYVKLDSDSATLTWRKPQCVLSGYIVSYSGEALWGEHRRDVGSIRVGEAVSEDARSALNKTVEVELLDIGSNTKSAVLSNLMPYAVYELCIAVTPAKNSTKNCLVIETEEEKPESPTLLSVDVVYRNNLNLKWNSPLNIRGKLRGYTVTWAKDTDIIGSEKNLLETYTITGLESCSTYHISVTASTGAGDGEPVRKQVTLGGASISIGDLKYVKLDSDSATLTWRKPQCVLSGYIVSYSGEALWGEHRRDVGSIRVGEAVSEDEESWENSTVRVELLDIGSNTKAAVLSNLMPNSFYELCIAVTPKTNGTRNCIAIKTEETSSVTFSTNKILVSILALAAVVTGIIVILIKRCALYQELFKSTKRRVTTSSINQPNAFPLLQKETNDIGNEATENQDSTNASSEDHSRRDEHEEAFPFRKLKMKSHQSTVFFISAGLDQDEVFDFLSLIWKNNVKIIITLENILQYWPEHVTGETKWKDFSVRMEEKKTSGRGYKLRTVTLEKGDEKKCLKQYHIKDDLSSTIPTSSYVTTKLVEDVVTETDRGPSTTILFSSSDDMVENFVTLFDEKLSEKMRSILREKKTFIRAPPPSPALLVDDLEVVKQPLN